MTNIMALTFAIGATVTSAFHTAMNNSAQSLQRFSRGISVIRAQKEALKSAFNSGAISAQQYAVQLNGLYGQMNKVITAESEYKRNVNVDGAGARAWRDDEIHGITSGRGHVLSRHGGLESVRNP